MRIVLWLSAGMISLLAFAVAQANDFPSMASVRIDSEEVVTRVGKSAVEERVLVVSGQILKKNRTILLDRRRLVPDEQGHFRAEIPMSSSIRLEKSVQIVVINDFGTLEKGELPIPEFSQSKPFSSSVFIPSVAFSTISFQEATVNLSEEAITAKLAFNHDFRSSGDEDKKWSLGVSSYFTALPFGASGASSAIRYFGLDGQAGYLLPFASRSWFLTIRGGASYTTTFVSNNIYGFQNLLGPQLYPELQHIFSNGGTASAFAKYVPNLNQTPVTFSSYELAGGISYSPQSARGWVYSLDFSDLDLNQNGFTAQSRMISLGVGVSL